MKKGQTKQIIIGALILSASFLYSDNGVVIKMPKVPEVPKVEAVVPKVIIIDGNVGRSNEEILKELLKEKEVIFSDHVAPEMYEEKDAADKVIEVGDIHNGRVAAYLHAPLMDVKSVEEILKKAGFNIVTIYKVDKKGLATSIVFTNAAIQASAGKIERGFASTLRVTIDKKNKLISVSNPIYLMKAFMQEEYDSALAEATLKTLRDNFKDLKNSDEVMKFIMLERFQFMEGMPKYNDMISVKKADHKKLVAKAKKHKNTLYTQELANGSTLVGVKLGKRTSKFIKKTGYQNAGLLPYPVLIENGEVKILDPKYYIAVMYPMLKMSQFMTISTVPGAINKDIDKMFR